ncbi:TPA: VWA domain-containing protein [Legionella feeleii]
MMADFHFLRPWWLLTCLPLLGFIGCLWRQSPRMGAWAAVCDSHLLNYLVQSKKQGKRHGALLFLLLSGLCMILSLAGPAWIRLPVPAYLQIQPRVLVLDMSDAMLANDLVPDRLNRAKFKLHDLFKRRDAGQLGLVVYTGEPFVVSPLTEDAQTIDALLDSLTPDIMPVEGQRLDSALEEAGELITQAGFDHGQILVLTAETPSLAAVEVASKLANKQIFTSVMPILANKTLNPLFERLAMAGKGQLVSFTDTSADLENWLKNTVTEQQYSRSQHNDIPMWRDEGRWFLLPALGFLLPVFRRGWLQRIAT